MNIPGLPPWDAHHFLWGMDSKYRQGYVRSKYQLASIYHPRCICEIGVYAGISACCFLAASPNAVYLGFDNMEAERNQGITIVDTTRNLLQSLGYHSTIHIADSQSLTELPGQFDFIHVDGCHQTACAQHDTEIAWRALTSDGVLLVDDCHNMMVTAGVCRALLDAGTDLLQWEYYPEGVGTMVIRKEPRVR